MTEDEMDVDSQQAAFERAQHQHHEADMDTDADEEMDENATPAESSTKNSATARTAEQSFVSANEGVEDQQQPQPDVAEDDAATIPDDGILQQLETVNASDKFEEEVEEKEEPNWTVAEDEDRGAEEMDEELDDAVPQSPSDAYSPEKPLLRKSSLTFASLPAREPLTAKRSIGQRSSVFGRSLGGKSLGASQRQDESEDEDGAEDGETHEQIPNDAHNKTSTQRLHERINMLGQSKEPRPSKSIPLSLANAQPAYPSLPRPEATVAAPAQEDDDDDWIAPISRTSQPAVSAETQSAAPAVSQPHSPERHTSPSRPGLGHHKSASETNIASPAKAAMAAQSLHKKAFSVSNPNLKYDHGDKGTTTPVASPNRQRFQDGPLSASKSRLYSVLSSAKKMFASSATTSAQAKVDAQPQAVEQSPQRENNIDIETDMSKMPGGLYPDLKKAEQSMSRPTSPVKPEQQAFSKFDFVVGCQSRPRRRESRVSALLIASSAVFWLMA